jgi:hypothetical protein
MRRRTFALALGALTAFAGCSSSTDPSPAPAPHVAPAPTKVDSSAIDVAASAAAQKLGITSWRVLVGDDGLVTMSGFASDRHRAFGVTVHVTAAMTEIQFVDNGGTLRVDAAGKVLENSVTQRSHDFVQPLHADLTQHFATAAVPYDACSDANAEVAKEALLMIAACGSLVADWWTIITIPACGYEAVKYNLVVSDRNKACAPPSPCEQLSESACDQRNDCYFTTSYTPFQCCNRFTGCPPAGTPPPKPCSAFSNTYDCGNHGCFWWSNNTCNAAAQPVCTATAVGAGFSAPLDCAPGCLSTGCNGQCGTVVDNCGDTLDCGACAGGPTCGYEYCGDDEDCCGGSCFEGYCS